MAKDARSGLVLMKTKAVTVGGKKLALSNLEKVMYPETGFTKGQVINYYTEIARCILPHLKNRPVTSKRFPNGVGEARIAHLCVRFFRFG